MTREELLNNTLKKIFSVRTTILQLSTGSGKTKIAIDCIKAIEDKLIKQGEEQITVNILVPRRALINNWKDELKKWDYHSKGIDIKCYNSIDKCNRYADIWIFDEAQHMSEARRETFIDMKISPTSKIIVLSATLPKEIMYFFESFGTYNIVKNTLNDAIEDNILPTPTIITIPIQLDTKNRQYTIIKNPRCNNPIECNFEERWNYIKRFSNRKIIIHCTARQYYSYMSDQIDWYKKRFMSSRSIAIKNKWLRSAGDRLKWLSMYKNNTVKYILSLLKEQRTLTFCNNIEQSEILGSNAIHSKTSKALKTLDDFNNNKIKHITAVHILDEGMNLKDCKVAIFANLNASEIIGIQRVGRSLRCKNPYIIIPYIVNSRDEEIKNKMLENYNKEYIINLSDISKIKEVKI